MTANLRPLLTLALIPIGAATLCGYAFDNPGNISVFLKWPDGQVVMHEQLGPGSGTLMDGSTGWNEAFEPALAAWNQAMTRLQFRPVRDSTAPIGFDNEVNNIIFASDAFGGYSFDDAPSLSFVYYAYSVIFESDIVLNRKYVWNSYRGKLRPGVMEIRRVALHDAGGALGLDSPDHYGQMVASIMNSEIGDIDALQADDITGAQALYGAPPGTPIDYGTVPFPPRGEVVAFENQLENYYGTVLRRRSLPTFLNTEGEAVWMSEFMRYIVNGCPYGTAVANMVTQVVGNPPPSVCGIGPEGQVNFPPRNLARDARGQLELVYSGTLRAPLLASPLDAEGSAVWTQEYLRLRVNGCAHGDAVQKVFLEIAGGSVQFCCNSALPVLEWPMTALAGIKHGSDTNSTAGELR